MTAAAISDVQYDFSLPTSGKSSHGISTVTSPKVHFHHWKCALTLAASSTLMWAAQGEGAYLIVGAQAVAYRNEGEAVDLTRIEPRTAQQRRVERLAQHGITLDMLRQNAHSDPITWDDTTEVEMVPPADVWNVEVNMDRLRQAREARKAARRSQVAGNSF